LIDELPNAKEIETKKKIYDEYANFVKEMSPKMENEVKTIKMENKINYGKAIGLMEELNAEYKQKNKKKSSVFDFIIKKCRKIFKTKRQKEVRQIK
jgi:hypothetical protein